MQYSDYNKTAQIKELSDVEGTDKEEYVHKEYVRCCLPDPFEDSYGEGIDGSMGKETLMCCEDADIVEGNLAIISGVTYRVVGVRRFGKFLGRNAHMELRIRQYND